MSVKDLAADETKTSEGLVICFWFVCLFFSFFFNFGKRWRQMKNKNQDTKTLTRKYAGIFVRGY